MLTTAACASEISPRLTKSTERCSIERCPLPPSREKSSRSPASPSTAHTIAASATASTKGIDHSTWNW